MRLVRLIHENMDAGFAITVLSLLGTPQVALANEPAAPRPTIAAANEGVSENIEPNCNHLTSKFEDDAEEVPVTPYTMPGTGLIFTLPGPSEESLAECPAPEPPLPTRPSAPDIFAHAAVPVGVSAMQAKWDAVRTFPFEGLHDLWEEPRFNAGGVRDSDPLGMVNLWVNWHIRYTDDVGGDQWSSASNTLMRGYGDCEDFAIAKMAILERLGISPDDMFLVLVKDRHRSLDHAVLAVRRYGELYVLDNRTDKVQLAEEISDYRPTASYSGPFAWVYGQVIPGRFHAKANAAPDAPPVER